MYPRLWCDEKKKHLSAKRRGLINYLVVCGIYFYSRWRTERRSPKQILISPTLVAWEKKESWSVNGWGKSRRDDEGKMGHGDRFSRNILTRNDPRQWALEQTCGERLSGIFETPMNAWTGHAESVQKWIESICWEFFGEISMESRKEEHVFRVFAE